MATVDVAHERVPTVEEGTAAKILRWVGKTPIYILLIAVGLMWLVPTFGLFITSLLGR